MKDGKRRRRKEGRSLEEIRNKEGMRKKERKKKE